MDYASHTVREILGRLRRDPTSLKAWADLLITCFDQRDSESLQSLQVIQNALDSLWNVARARSLGGEEALGVSTYSRRTVQLTLNKEQLALLVDLAQKPSDPENLTRLAILCRNEFNLTEPAITLLQRAISFDPANIELQHLLQQYAQPPSDFVILPDDDEPLPKMDSSPELVSEPPSRQTLSTLVRRTSKFAPDLIIGDDVKKPAHPVKEPSEPASHGEKPTPSLSEHITEKQIKLSSAVPLGFSMAQTWLEKALVSIQSGELEKAAESCTRAEEIDPHAELLWNVWNLVGLGFFERGEPAQAVRAYKQATSSRPDFFEAWFNYGVASQEIGETEQAFAAYKRVLELSPDHAVAWSNVGNLYLQCGQTEDALSSFKRAVTINPDYAKAWDGLAAAYTESGLTDEAIDACKKALEISPHLTESTFKLGMLIFQNNRYAEVIPLMTQVVTAWANFAEARCYLAMARALTGDIESALADVRLAESQEPECPLLWATWHTLSSAQYEHRHYLEAQTSAGRMAQLEPKNGKSWIQMGLTQIGNGKVEEALGSLQKATTLLPHSATAWQQLGLAHYRLHQYREAIMSFAQASTIHPGDAMNYYYRAVVLEKQNEPEQALKMYRMAVQSDDKLLVAWKNASSLYLERGYKQESVEACLKVTDLQPNDPSAWYWLGLALQASGDISHAQSAFERVTQLDQNFSEAWAALSKIYQNAGRYDDARRALSESLQSKSEAPV